MSDSRKRHDEMEEDYLRRCRKYGEEPIIEKGTGDNVGLEFVQYYGNHAHQLLRREIAEDEIKVKKSKKRKRNS